MKCVMAMLPSASRLRTSRCLEFRGTAAERGGVELGMRYTQVLVAIGSSLFAVTACGAPVEPGAVASPASEPAASFATVAFATVESTTTTASLPPDTVAVTTTTAPDAMTKRWLFPSSDPPGMHLIGAQRQVVPDCGMTDCGLTMAIATLAYDSSGTTERRFRMTQSSPPHAATTSDAPAPPDLLDSAPERSAGDRRVRVVEGAGDIRVAWTEPDGDIVRVDSMGISWDDLAAIIGGLQPIDPSAWPTVTPTAAGFCVDASSQIAPTTPDGWQRLVLQARPAGNCDEGPILTMSLVLPGTAAGTGKLVTITIGGAGVPIPLGDPVVINGTTGYVNLSTMADGTASASISIDIGGVAVEAHGTVDEDQLVAIVASFHPLDATEWAALVNSVVQPP